MGEALPIVGVIGTGKMGAPMVQRLLAAGHRVLVFNRTTSRAMPLVAAGAVVTRSVPPGATVVGNPARVIKQDLPGPSE